MSVCVPHDSYPHTKHGVYTARNFRDCVAVLRLLGAGTQCTDGKFNQTSTHVNGELKVRRSRMILTLGAKLSDFRQIFYTNEMRIRGQTIQAWPQQCAEDAPKNRNSYGTTFIRDKGRSDYCRTGC